LQILPKGNNLPARTRRRRRRTFKKVQQHTGPLKVAPPEAIERTKNRPKFVDFSGRTLPGPLPSRSYTCLPIFSAALLPVIGIQLENLT
jgi:hypothetical protein